MSYAAPKEEPADLDLVEVSRTVWRGRWLVAAIVGVFVAGAVVYALTAQEWFRAEVVLVPADRKAPVGMGQLGGLASIAGIDLGNNADPAAMLILRSRDFAREFIESRDLLPILYAEQWDPAAKRWKDSDPARIPDIREAVDFFGGQIRHISEDQRTGEIRLGISWTDPDIAASWANDIVHSANIKLRDRANDEARRNIGFLRDQMAESDIPSIQQAIGRALESEMQKLMLARSGDEYAFKVIDRAVAPRTRESPRRRLVTLLAAALGLMCGVAVVLLRDSFRDHKA